MEIHLGRISRVRQLTDRDLYDSVTAWNHKDERVTNNVLRPHFQKIMEQFSRNRVEITYRIEDAPKTSSVSDNVADDILDKIKVFCDGRCSGYWRWEHSFNSLDSWNRTTSSMDYSGKARGVIKLYFENGSDIEIFEQECALMLKLAY